MDVHSTFVVNGVKGLIFLAITTVVLCLELVKDKYIDLPKF